MLDKEILNVYELKMPPNKNSFKIN